MKWLLLIPVLPSLLFCDAAKGMIISDEEAKTAIVSAHDYYPIVDSIFREMLGRDPIDAERMHFGALLATPHSNPYQIRQAIMKTQEYLEFRSRERRDRFVLACLQSMAGSLNIYRHEEMEDLAIQCANRLMRKLEPHLK